VQSYCEQLGKANLTALVSCLCSKDPGSPEDFSSVVQLLDLQHCIWQPQRSCSALVISQFQTHCCGRAGSNFPNSAANASTPNFLQSKEPCQVPYSLCFFQMVLWVSQIVQGTYGCAAEFHPNFSQKKYFDSFKQSLTIIFFQVKFLLSTYHFILKRKAIFLRISEVSVEWKCFI